MNEEKKETAEKTAASILSIRQISERLTKLQIARQYLVNCNSPRVFVASDFSELLPGGFDGLKFSIDWIIGQHIARERSNLIKANEGLGPKSATDIFADIFCMK